MAFRCPQCTLSYSTKYNLKRHYNQKHDKSSSSDEFVCRRCLTPITMDSDPETTSSENSDSDTTSTVTDSESEGSGSSTESYIGEAESEDQYKTDDDVLTQYYMKQAMNYQ